MGMADNQRTCFKVANVECNYYANQKKNKKYEADDTQIILVNVLDIIIYFNTMVIIM